MNIKIDEIHKNKNKLLKIKSDCYDLVYNGFEIASGAARIYLPELQKKVFEIVGFSQKRIKENFGWFVEAYNYGAPQHRGIAFGIDRLIMILEKRKSIRDVIAFPKNKHGHCPLTNSPTKVSKEKLKEIGIEFKINN